MELPANTIVAFIVAVCIMLALIYFFFTTNQQISIPIIQTSNSTGEKIKNQTNQIINLTNMSTANLDNLGVYTETSVCNEG